MVMQQHEIDMVKAVSEIGVREGRLAALREVREMVINLHAEKVGLLPGNTDAAASVTGYCVSLVADIDAMIRREEDAK